MEFDEDDELRKLCQEADKERDLKRQAALEEERKVLEQQKLEKLQKLNKLNDSLDFQKREHMELDDVTTIPRYKTIIEKIENNEYFNYLDFDSDFNQATYCETRDEYNRLKPTFDRHYELIKQIFSKTAPKRKAHFEVSEDSYDRNDKNFITIKNLKLFDKESNYRYGWTSIIESIENGSLDLKRNQQALNSVMFKYREKDLPHFHHAVQFLQQYGVHDNDHSLEDYLDRLNQNIATAQQEYFAAVGTANEGKFHMKLLNAQAELRQIENQLNK